MVKVGRLHREVSITVSASTAEAMLTIVRARRRQVRQAAGVWVWTRSGGRVRARGFTTSRFQPVPPHFAGRFVAGEPGGELAGEPGGKLAGEPGGQLPGEPGGQLVGSIRESWLQLLIPRLFGFAALLLALGGVAVVIADDSFSIVGFLVCTVGAIVLGWLAYLLGRGRAGDFATGADELKRALTQLVPPAPGKRSRRSTRG